MGPGVGAPSMYLTLQRYLNSPLRVNIFTTESHLINDDYGFSKIVCLSKYSLLKMKNPLLRKFTKFPNWIFLNFVQLIYLLCHRPKGLIYCYEYFFIPSSKIYTHLSSGTTFISRYQGTILGRVLERKHIFSKYLYIMRKLEHWIALNIKADLIIMSDDGTEGDSVLKSFGNTSELLFLKNGLGWPIYAPKPRVTFENCTIEKIQKTLNNSDYINFYICSRLVKWKRVERSIAIFSKINESHPNTKLYIFGSGPEQHYLEKLVTKLDLQKKIFFQGSIPQFSLIKLINQMDYFISCYSLSNVGNPLWEAINANCKVITLSNGDTGRYIKNGINGFIVPESNYLKNAHNVINYLNGSRRSLLQPNLPKDLVSWSARLDIEFNHVTRL